MPALPERISLMDRRITALLTGCALCASGFFAGVSIAPTPEASKETAACGSATGSDRDVILCRSSDAEPSPVAQPADEALRARLNDAMLALERQGRLAAFTAVPQTDPARIPDLPEASLQGGPLDP